MPVKRCHLWHFQPKRISYVDKAQIHPFSQVLLNGKKVKRTELSLTNNFVLNTKAKIETNAFLRQCSVQNTKMKQQQPVSAKKLKYRDCFPVDFNRLHCFHIIMGTTLVLFDSLLLCLSKNSRVSNSMPHMQR